ncbi:hypothetical protein KQX54_011476 [Cotesia glomerata]|uniref:Spondin domain-containing protein n=1 Tax=Cotesia glomerata TaxID=32391 RepID=A0AAV7IPN1_COTGL|nr:hypothetical protein KQX54_011476 [Cotesia glomerata]
MKLLSWITSSSPGATRIKQSLLLDSQRREKKSVRGGKLLNTDEAKNYYVKKRNSERIKVVGVVMMLQNEETEDTRMSSRELRGRTHDSTYTLYRLGERLSPGAMQYVETGRTDSLDTGGDSPNILDVFGGPGIPQGEGSTVTRTFLDGNHTLVSMMARINPSPDWFVGVDSFQLCVEGNWVDTVTVELDPLDGGTDNGFTFTAANWPTNPQGIAYRITSRYPAHPAGSFYYPNLPRLPPIATLTFTKRVAFVGDTFN